MELRRVMLVWCMCLGIVVVGALPLLGAEGDEKITDEGGIPGLPTGPQPQKKISAPQSFTPPEARELSHELTEHETKLLDMEASTFKPQENDTAMVQDDGAAAAVKAYDEARNVRSANSR